METKTNPLKEIFDELFGLLESLEAQSMAVMQFLKDQNAGNDKKLTPYLEQAGNASSVKWRAARARMEYLLAPIQKEADDKKKDADSREADKKAAETKEPNKQEPEKQEQQPEKQKTDPADTKGGNRDKPPAGDAEAKSSKSTDSSAAKPEQKDKSKPEPERK